MCVFGKVYMYICVSENLHTHIKFLIVWVTFWVQCTIHLYSAYKYIAINTPNLHIHMLFLFVLKLLCRCLSNRSLATANWHYPSDQTTSALTPTDLGLPLFSLLHFPASLFVRQSFRPPFCLTAIWPSFSFLPPFCRSLSALWHSVHFDYQPNFLFSF